MVTNDNLIMKYSGLSTDTKPEKGVPNGSTFVEMDTQILYVFDEESSEWVQQDSGNAMMLLRLTTG